MAAITSPMTFNQQSIHHQEFSDFDATVVVGDERIGVHKAILSSRIPFFRGLFDSNMAECVSGEVTITQFEFASVKALIDYAYTGKLNLDGTNVQDLLMTADFLGMEPAKFIKEYLEASNALPVLVVSRFFEWNEAVKNVLRFIDTNFVDFSLTPDFLNLSVSEVKGLLKRENICVKEEKEVFEALTRWIDVDDKRMKHATRLLRCVRCTLIPTAQITEMLKTSWVVSNQGCRDLLEEAKEYTLNPALSQMESFNTRPRNCTEIVAVGYTGYPSNVENSAIALYDPIDDKWTTRQKLPNPRDRNGVAVAGSKLYLIGGRETAWRRLRTCDVYDFETDQWSQAPELNTTIASMATGVIDGKIYVAGGFEGRTASDTVEMLNPSSEAPGKHSWLMMKPMSKSRSAPASCVLDGLLYVFGGTDGFLVHDDGEYYNPATNAWTPIAPMRYKRMRFGAAVLNGHIYVAGGFDGAAFLRDVERYDPQTNTWRTLRNLKERRSRASVAVSCGKLYVFGGFDGLCNVSSVEMYEPESDTWIPRAEIPGSQLFGFVTIPAWISSPKDDESGKTPTFRVQ